VYSGTANNAAALSGVSLATLQGQITGNSATAYANALFASGTTLLFAQTTAPTGWTKVTTHNDKALRVVNGTAGSGGSISFTSAFTSQSVSGSIANTTASGTIANTTSTGSVSVTVANTTSTGTVGNQTAGGTISSETAGGTISVSVQSNTATGS
jgi:hypothetical protein